MSRLSVRLDGPDVIRDITRQVGELTFKSVARGGYASVTVQLARALDASLLDAFTDLLVFDSETGAQVGGGRLLDQGRDSSKVWQLIALGEGLASMQDSEAPYVLIDSSLSSWATQARSTRRLSAAAGQHPTSPNDVEGLLMQGSEDKLIPTGSSVRMINRVLAVAGQEWGAISFRHTDGAETDSWVIRLSVFNTDVEDGSPLYSDTWANSTTPRRRIRWSDVFGTSGRPVVGLSWIRDGIAADATDNTWSLVRDPVVQARMLGRDGNARTGSFYDTDYVLAHEVFIDLLARFCPRLDVANAVIDSTPAHRFDQLSWLDGITPMAAMEEILDVEAGYTWAAWEKTQSGKWLVEFRALPTEVRYELTAEGGFSAPSPFSEVYDRVVVRGKTRTGREGAVVRTQTVPALKAAGITRTATLDLGDEVFSQATATKRGDAFLAAHAAPPNAGTVTVGRKAYDRQTGRWVKPYEIRPGSLALVRGVQPSPDSLNTSGPNGSTVFSIESNEYSDVDGVSVLELDAYSLAERRAIASLARRRRRKR